MCGFISCLVDVVNADFNVLRSRMGRRVVKPQETSF